MSGGSSANNSWTILTPEETATETLRPLAEGTEHHEESVTSAAGSGENLPAGVAESAEGLPVEGHLVSEEKTAGLSGDTSTEQHTTMPTAITDAPVSTPLEGSGSFVPDSDALSQSEGLPEGPAQSNPDPDSFSDSYTHITPSPHEPPSTLLSTETLGGSEFTQEEERLTQEGTLHPLNGEGLQQEGEDSDLSTRTTDIGKQADSLVDSQVGEERTEKIGEEGEPEVRRRRSLLAALERIGRTEEEEEGEEEFQLPQREEDSGFSVNKCILGAVILLGLGTIFFSESDYGTRELKDAELPGKQEWFNQDVPPPPVDADSTELLNKLAKGNQQISVLQAQLQAQKEELKVAKGQAAEGAKERLLWEEMEKENSRLKKEMASLPVLQKENERMKRELESVPALQKELETLRSTVTELKLSSGTSEAAQAPVKHATSPSSGQPEDSTQSTAGSIERQPWKPWDDQREKKKVMKKDKNDISEKKDGKEGLEKSKWREKEKRQSKDGGKTEWNKGKHEEGKFDKKKEKDFKQKSDEAKQWKEKDWKKEKASRGDEGKPWKDREGKKEWIEKRERKEWKEEKDWKKAKHGKVNEGKQLRSQEEKNDWTVGKDHGEKHKGREEWKGEKEWKKGKDGYKGSGKEKWERKDWKEKGEKKEWKKDGNWKSKNGKDHSKEGKWTGERKQWEESKNHGKDSKWKDERKQGNENEWKSKNGKDDKEWKRKDERKHVSENEWRSKNGEDFKEWKRRDERKQGNENEWRSKNGKDDKAWKRKDERKQGNENEWRSKNGKDDKAWKRKDERKQGNENEWRSKNERKQWEKKEEQWNRGGQKERKYNGDLNKDTSSSQKHKEEHKFTGNHGHETEHLWGDKKPPHTHRRPSLEQPEYWVQQRERLQHNPKPPQHCNSLETCAQAEGLLPVPFPEFEAILQTYLAKAEEVGVDASKREELKKLATEFFKDGVFVHDQMSFQDFAEDLGDVLEDMVEGDDSGDEEDSAIEEEMEEFEREVLKKFSVPGAEEKEERPKGDQRKESVRGRG
ncbi:pre-B-cell leukemia homeobox interacting protein 1b isoform X2 [Chelmon rostratus]|uniref:pre-B-cell leukemia homeobox interacting protein 1b isoform X2 n=1 Tax=Chelmon rostratus TaxID=109905 RepID=UPI001BEC88C0|nr:pre-B-cell leukemia homeobox interacting protein 1b isoform X2 [Chelmon rostratus]